MDITQSAGNGHASTVVSILLGIFTIFTKENVELGIRILAGLGSIAAAIGAVRYYYFAIKEKKASIKRHKGHH